MARYTLQGVSANFTVHIDIALSVQAKPGVRTIQSADDVLWDIGYKGPSIGFGGNGIHFLGRGMLLNSTSANVGVEIGFLQSMTYSVTEGIYQSANVVPKYVRRSQPALPIKDGSPTDIWYATDGNALAKYTPQQVTTLSRRFGTMHSFGFQIKTKDQVKSTFPTTYKFPSNAAALPITGFSLTRHFITCIAVRAKPSGAASQTFFMDRVTWQCSYVGQVGNNGMWSPAPGATQFYQVANIVRAASPFSQPNGLMLVGNTANAAEVTSIA